MIRRGQPNVEGAQARVAGSPHLGDFRTPLGLVVPAGLPGRFRARVAGADEVVLASIFQLDPAADERLSEAKLVADLRGEGGCARATCRRSTRLSATSRKRRAKATSWW